jgi:nicotinamide-nucleotide amidase
LLAVEISRILTKQNATVAVAESSSGGLVSAALVSVAGASKYFIGGSVLYSYPIRKAIVGMGKEEHIPYGGSTPELVMAMAKNFHQKIPATWIIAEGGAAGPSNSPYGHPAGYTALAVSGPINRTRIIETKKNDRIKNMLLFTAALLEFFLEVIKEQYHVK